MKFDEERWRTLAANKPDELHSFIPQSSISELFDEIERLEHEIASLREQVRWRKYPEEEPEADIWYWTDCGWCEYTFGVWEDTNHVKQPVRFYINVLVSLDNPPQPPKEVKE